MLTFASAARIYDFLKFCLCEGTVVDGHLIELTIHETKALSLSDCERSVRIRERSWIDYRTNWNPINKGCEDASFFVTAK